VSAPCTGLRIVEIAVGTSDVGLGLAGGIPGMILADLGADVVRVMGEPVGIDQDLTWSHAWHRSKRIVRTDEVAPVLDLLRDADVALVYGSTDIVEDRGLGYGDVAASNPQLVYARCRPSDIGAGRTAPSSTDRGGRMGRDLSL